MGLLSWATGADQRESDRLDARRQALNVKAKDLYGEKWYQQTVANDAKTDADEADAENHKWDDFAPDELVKNLGESVSKVTPGARSFLESVISFPLKSIPPVGWVLLGVAAFFWLGGHLWLRRVVASKG